MAVRGRHGAGGVAQHPRVAVVRSSPVVVTGVAVAGVVGGVVSVPGHQNAH